MIAVRHAATEDLPELIMLWKELMAFHQDINSSYPLKKNSSDIVKDFFAENIKSPDSILLIAKDGKKAVGYLLAFIKAFPPVYVEDRMGYISDGYVTEPYRGKGIMKDMISETKAFFKKKGMEHIYLRADTMNTSGVDAWKAIGFEEEAKEMYMEINDEP